MDMRNSVGGGMGGGKCEFVMGGRNGSLTILRNNQIRAIHVRWANFPGANRRCAAPAEVIVHLTIGQDQKQLLVYWLGGSAFGTIQRRSAQRLKLAICRSVHIVSSCSKRRNRQRPAAKNTRHEN